METNTVLDCPMCHRPLPEDVSRARKRQLKAGGKARWQGVSDAARSEQMKRVRRGEKINAK